MSAVSAGREEAVILLLENGADVNAENSSGQTALHYAVQLLILAYTHCPAQHAMPLMWAVLIMRGLFLIVLMPAWHSQAPCCDM